MALEIFDERLKRRLPGIFPGQSLASMRPEVMSETVVDQEPMPERINVSEYLDAISEIKSRRAKMSGRVNAMRGFTGRSQNFSFGPIAGEAELRERMKITDEQLNDAILERQRAAILRGEINNIDEQMAWYQKGGYDPHFAKEARTAAQSIFAQRRAQTGEERAVAGEERAVLGEARAVDTAARAQENLDINIAQERRAAATNARQSTDRSRADVRTTREDSILEWMVREYETRSAVAGADPVAIWDDVKSEGMGHARDKEFIGFEMVAGEYIPRESEDPSYTAKQTTGINLDEKRIFDEFKNEIPRPSVKDDKDEDFVSAPARTYSDQYEEDWRTAADDFETASDLAGTINAAIRADESIAPENKQAVLQQVLTNLESVEKGVARPAEVAPLTDERRMNELITAVTTLTGDLTADRANRHKAHIRIKRENRIQNPFVRALTRDEQNDEGFIQMEDFLSIDEETAIDLDIQQSFMDRINAVNEMRKLDDLSAFILEADPSFKIPAGYDADELKKAILRKIKRDYEDFTVMPRGYSESVIRRNKED